MLVKPENRAPSHHQGGPITCNHGLRSRKLLGSFQCRLSSMGDAKTRMIVAAAILRLYPDNDERWSFKLLTKLLGTFPIIYRPVVRSQRIRINPIMISVGFPVRPDLIQRGCIVNPPRLHYIQHVERVVNVIERI